MKIVKKPQAKEIIEKFKLEVILNGESAENEIEYVTISRGGLELSGVFVYKKIMSIVYLGQKESIFLDSLNDEKAKEAINNIFKMKPPLLLLGVNFKRIDLIKEIGSNYKDVPIAKTNFNFIEVNFTISNYLIEEMISYNNHHGSLIEVYGIGVLLIGEPGVGKSEITIELVRKGHIFVGDDAIDIARIGNKLKARASLSTKGFIEVRGLGILNFEKTFGYHKSVDSTEIKVIIELIEHKESNNTSYERIGKKNYKLIEGVEVAYYKIPLHPGRRTSEIIESAITDFKLKKLGYDSQADLLKKVSSGN